jgi:hypothetical protein
MINQDEVDGDDIFWNQLALDQPKSNNTNLNCPIGPIRMEKIQRSNRRSHSKEGGKKEEEKQKRSKFKTTNNPTIPRRQFN